MECPLPRFERHHIGLGANVPYILVMNAQLKREIARLSLEERLELFETLWDDDEDAKIAPKLTAEQKALLDQRYDEYLKNPDAPLKTLKEIAAGLGGCRRLLGSPRAIGEPASR
jgi:putative addiction module component (TIGR02574 family)